ncbi:MAG TPA: hypothetical protein VFA66_07335 [Gaiellaceae bacterium]|nr:hypothetical protein [Gaiellaceae bacterium]
MSAAGEGDGVDLDRLRIARPEGTDGDDVRGELSLFGEQAEVRAERLLVPGAEKVVEARTICSRQRSERAGSPSRLSAASSA